MFTRLLLATLLIPSLAVADAVWWRSSGGAVVQVGNTCSLVIENNSRAAIISWTKGQMPTIAFQGTQLDQSHYDVQVRIGNTWLNHNLLMPADVYVSRDKQTLLTVPISEPIEELLRTSSEILALLPDREIIIEFNKIKMPALLAAGVKCRAQLK